MKDGRRDGESQPKEVFAVSRSLLVEASLAIAQVALENLFSQSYTPLLWLYREGSQSWQTQQRLALEDQL